MRLADAALAAMIVVVASERAHADEATLPAAGRMIAERLCGACHATGPDGASPHPAAPPFRVFASRMELDDIQQHLQEGIVAGHRDMPFVRLSRQDARAMRSYLRSLQKP